MEVVSDDASDNALPLDTLLAEAGLPPLPAGTSLSDHLRANDIEPYTPDRVAATIAAYYPEWNVMAARPQVARRHLSLIADPDFSDIESATREASSHLGSLCVMAGDPNASVRDLAMVGLATAQAALTPSGDERVEHPVFAMGRFVDDGISSLRAQIPAFPGPTWVSNAWMVTGVLVTAGTACLLTLGHPLLAGIALLARQVLSLFLGGDGSLPFEVTARAATSSSVLRCEATHTADAIMLAGFLGYAYANHNTVGFVFSVLAMGAMFTGVMTREAALQVGVQITRLTMERPIRVWPAIGVLLLFGISDFASDQWGTTALVIAGTAGCLAYGVGETIRSLIRVQVALRGKHQRRIFVTTDDTLIDGTRWVTSSNRTVQGTQYDHTRLKPSA